MQKCRFRSEIGSGRLNWDLQRHPVNIPAFRLRLLRISLVVLAVDVRLASLEMKRLKQEVVYRHPAPAELRSDEDLPRLI